MRTNLVLNLAPSAEWRKAAGHQQVIAERKQKVWSKLLKLIVFLLQNCCSIADLVLV